MTRNTQQFVLNIAFWIASLGFIGWLMWKVGVVDTIIWAAQWALILFPLAALFAGVLSPATFNMYSKGVNDAFESVRNLTGTAFTKGVNVAKQKAEETAS